MKTVEQLVEEIMQLAVYPSKPLRDKLTGVLAVLLHKQRVLEAMQHVITRPENALIYSRLAQLCRDNQGPCFCGCHTTEFDESR